MENEERYASVRKYSGHTLQADTAYSVLYYRTQFGDAPAMAAITIRPQQPYDACRQQTRLNVVSLPAGTAVSDAVVLLSLAVPVCYRDLWHSITVDDRHHMEWEGVRKS